jgi:hypothetical protein
MDTFVMVEVDSHANKPPDTSTEQPAKGKGTRRAKLDVC